MFFFFLVWLSVTINNVYETPEREEGVIKKLCARLQQKVFLLFLFFYFLCDDTVNACVQIAQPTYIFFFTVSVRNVKINMKIVCVGVNQKKKTQVSFFFFFFVFWPYRLVEMLYHYYCYYYLFPPRLGLRYWSSIGKRLRDTTRTAGLLRKHSSISSR